jgi:AraC family transcriptional regulator, regulatory protein of adaptative response / DNA-3-methyladenine glycosylase II
VTRLPYVAPLAWTPLLSFLAARAIPGVEVVHEDAYRRVIAIDGRDAVIDVRCNPLRRCVELRASDRDVSRDPRVIARVRRVFDLDADPGVIAEHFAVDALLAPRVRRVPGLRVPGAWDGFELGLRAILGQQVTVKGASTLAGRLVSQLGRPLSTPVMGLTHQFPEPAVVAAGDLSRIGVPGRRQASLRGFAAAVASDAVLLTRAAVDARLRELPGFGDWTAQYVLMRACGDPDAFPASDLWLRRMAGADTVSALVARADAWRPFRAYAAMYLWQGA